MSKPILIGIAGGTASGKTSVARKIYEHFNDEKSVIIIREDDYYKFQTIPFEERKKTNYDHPFAFDYELMHKQLDDLLSEKSIEKPTYDYSIHNRSDVTETVCPADVIILEGLFVLEEESLRKRLDIKIFVDTPADVRLSRRILRDIKERGRDIDNILDQYLTTVRVMHDEFIEPSKKYAHVIIPEGGSNDVGIDLLITKINSIISERVL